LISPLASAGRNHIALGPLTHSPRTVGIAVEVLTGG
jgi:hypothetical protein